MTIQKGSLIQLGEHYLLCEDSTDAINVELVIQERKIDLVLTDPPYGCAYVEGKEDFTQSLAKPKVILNDHAQSEEEYQAFTERWMKPIVSAMAEKNSVYVFNTDKMLFALRDGMEKSGFKFAQMLIWAKTHAVIGRMDYLPQHELIAYGWYGRHEFMQSKDKSILVYPKPSKSKYHPTSKPLGLLRRLILNSSQIGDTVYDPFGGGGSTLLACEQTKRKCIMIEIDAEYCETIVMLWERLSGERALVITPPYASEEKEISQS